MAPIKRQKPQWRTACVYVRVLQAIVIVVVVLEKLLTPLSDRTQNECLMTETTVEAAILKVLKGNSSNLTDRKEVMIGFQYKNGATE